MRFELIFVKFRKTSLIGRSNWKQNGPFVSKNEKVPPFLQRRDVYRALTGSEQGAGLVCDVLGSDAVFFEQFACGG